MPRTKSRSEAERRAGAGLVDTEPAGAALLAIARARPRDPRLLHPRAARARDRGHRRRARHEPLDDAPLRDHARRARIPRAGRLAQVPARPARHRPRHVGAQLHGPARARAPLPRGAAPAHLLHRQPRRARRDRGALRGPGPQLPPRPEPGRPRPCRRARACPRTAPRWARCCSPTCRTASCATRSPRSSPPNRARRRSPPRRSSRTSSRRSATPASPSTTRSSQPACYAIAAPVRNEARDVVAAVNLTAPSSMIALEELVDALGPHLVSTADRISARLGYRRDDERNH